jgi:hypothetical protein
MTKKCNICDDETISFNTRCKTCKKSTCVKCYDNISGFSICNNKVSNIYKCPYCRESSNEDIKDLNSDILSELLNTSVLQSVELFKIRDENENKIKKLETKLNESSNDNNTHLKEFYKYYISLNPTRKTIKLTELKLYCGL